MEKTQILICGIVGFLGVLSAALAFAAEATKITASEVVVNDAGNCSFPTSPAMGLGLCSVLALLIGKGTIDSLTGCVCCKQRPYGSDKKWSIGLISFIVSWVTFVMATLLLLSGSALNDQRNGQYTYFGYVCAVAKPGVFTTGGILSLVTIILGIVYYLALAHLRNTQPVAPVQNINIAMGQPQIPPRSEEPVFVHEDTYNRRQQLP